MGKQKAGEVREIKAKNTVNCVLRLSAVLKQTPPGRYVALYKHLKRIPAA
jgi:hypothetical protein